MGYMLVHKHVTVGVSGVLVLANYKRYKWNFATIEADIRHAMVIEVYEYIHCITPIYYSRPIDCYNCWCIAMCYTATTTRAYACCEVLYNFSKACDTQRSSRRA
jgi:uncharacterized membrane protein YpjA